MSPWASLWWAPLCFCFVGQKTGPRADRSVASFGRGSRSPGSVVNFSGRHPFEFTVHIGFLKKRVHSSHHSPLVDVLAVPPIRCAVAPTGKLSRSMRRDPRKASFNAHVFILMQVDCNKIKLSFILIHSNTYELEWIHMHLKTLSQYHIVEPKIN
jgi:hypothetical protein